ncbi:uncharacterized protein [Zea mays]|uniref:uncharacterized protein n=1 Tax=Zea mays TaxID=4577 RepID=UPI000C6C7628|nr:uncharacterized protein LOC103633310 [Zea mays]|eukprot:XP_023156345.1 uncharacterized protein LOC103633310 [Zea mays]
MGMWKVVCVTDASAYIASWIVRLLLDRGYTVRATVRDTSFGNVEPTSVDLFKNFHYSKNNGFIEFVQKAIDDMEGIMSEPVQDGHEPKLANEAVSQVVKINYFSSCCRCLFGLQEYL